MTDQTFPPITLSPAERPAHPVTFEDYMRLYAENFAEWVEGKVIPLSPVTYEHNQLDGFFYHILRVFLSRTRMGRVLRSPFVMRLSPDAPAREPDLQVILNENLPIIQPTLTAGAADVVIEIVSKESQQRNLVEKYDEYEAGGVREYWLINPLRKQVTFTSAPRMAFSSASNWKMVCYAHGCYRHFASALKFCGTTPRSWMMMIMCAPSWMPCLRSEFVPHVQRQLTE